MLRRVLFVWTAVLAGACGPGKATTEEDPTEGGSTSMGEETSGGETDPTMPPTPTTGGETNETTEGPNPTEPNTVALLEANDVDILFVLDNSGSMSEEQAILADSIQALLAGLDGLNWRIGMTTTDAGNPRCPTSTPENGALVLSSCLDRVSEGEFESNDEDFSAACTDRCAASDADLVVLPTATEVDDNQVPRKWIERVNGVLNIEGVADANAALQCYLPQGVAGCGFESHLQSMFKAVAGAQDANNKTNFGFLRSAAVLAVVMVSDETDCSFAAEHSDIFVDNKVFWNDPNDVAPTSALCWRAGVACTGNAPTWAECHAENWDEGGMPGAADGEAVLLPVSKFVEFLQQVEDQKQQFDSNQQVLVSLITGVPPGYETFDAELVFEDSQDPEFQELFGIGPGCISGDPNTPQTAVPPVREREWAEAFAQEGGRNLSSICAPDYSEALGELAQAIQGQIPPTCFPACVADVNPETSVVDVNCEVFEENLVQQTRVPVIACDNVGGVWTVPAGMTVCFAPLVDRDGQATPSELDDMSPVCVDEGFNLEFEIVRSAPRPAGTTLSATCELSGDKAKDCPNL